MDQGAEDLSFPSGEELLSAIRGHHVGQHPLDEYAHELGSMYTDLLAQPELEELSQVGTASFVGVIDEWVAARLPQPRPGAALHTEGIGAVIDRMAAALIHAYHLLMTLDPAGPRVHAAWSHLAELVDAYTDLTTEVLHRSRRLPVLEERS
ncbi:DUF4254 domain-containing protein [Nocardia sp. NBC_00565]|uniref:DUF4254 domain-containing protein n=1 Tax=Nocardia sp. NBC_00565 TaxID=2975993 RepID=UPI002E80281C|nr:DUF4254 domain-containing protein [Nocardia sp. NBC_00565]WUC02027.1 DUF4254 domain-containing protein [Nocardia sp. NBC_00565]